MGEDLKKEPSLIQECIDILENGGTPPKEKRFSILRKLYKLQDTKKGRLVDKVVVQQACYEVMRLHRIDTPESEINRYIESL